MDETLSGIIERVSFHNPENGFAVLRVKAKGKRELVTVVGQVPRVVAGEHLEASGTWREDPEHGVQFKAQELRISAPHTVEGIAKYLGSGLVKGIGPRYAQRIVAVFGERTLKVIDESPTFLSEIRGIGPRRIQQIRESWKQQKVVREILVFLQSHGIGTARAVRIYKTYGDKALEIVQANPYRLAEDIWGVGFQTADQLADRLGIERQSPLRARAALHFVLQDLTGEGHCGYAEEEVIQKASELTGIAREVLQDAVAALVDEKALVRETWDRAQAARLLEAPVSSSVPPSSRAACPWLYLPHLFFAEVGIARTLGELQDGKHPLPTIDVAAAVAWVEKRMGLELAEHQRDAIRQALRSKVLVITGGPGVGKTTLVRGILEIFQAKKARCGLCAPTGRAAKRLTEATGQEAKTIHRLLEYQGGQGKPRRNRDNPLDVDLLIVDEVSMVDVSLMYQLLRAVPATACVVLVGDVDQLPSVGPGTVLGDLIASGVVPVARLTRIFRQAQESRIVQAAYSVHQGDMPVSTGPEQLGDFYIVEADQPPDILDRVIRLVRDRIPARFGLDPVRDVQILTPMNRAELGTRNLNLRLQEVFNPPGDGPEVARFGLTYRIGDKVLQTVNNYQKEVFNGDIGRIKAIDGESQEMTVDFEGHEVVYDFEELDELLLAYALTIHKSQGSEYPAVVIVLHTQHFLMLQRNLLYTALTRGKKLVVLVGAGKAMAMAVRRQDTSQRCTALAWRLKQQSVSQAP